MKDGISAYNNNNNVYCNQTSWVVEVVPVHFITLESTHSSWTLAHDAEYLPRGANLDIKVINQLSSIQGGNLRYKGNKSFTQGGKFRYKVISIIYPGGGQT